MHEAQLDGAVINVSIASIATILDQDLQQRVTAGQSLDPEALEVVDIARRLPSDVALQGDTVVQILEGATWIRTGQGRTRGLVLQGPDLQEADLGHLLPGLVLDHPILEEEVPVEGGRALLGGLEGGGEALATAVTVVLVTEAEVQAGLEVAQGGEGDRAH
ncbi:MAG: hypothetical protein M1839_004848 [Geoglossum umbratile]|nr:MAG: hypothetical protein M1839_004848 [Geoglossum umbratile]